MLTTFPRSWYFLKILILFNVEKHLSASAVVMRIGGTNRSLKDSENVFCKLCAKKNCRRLTVNFKIRSFVNNFKFCFLNIWARLVYGGYRCSEEGSIPIPGFEPPSTSLVSRDFLQSLTVGSISPIPGLTPPSAVLGTYMPSSAWGCIVRRCLQLYSLRRNTRLSPNDLLCTGVQVQNLEVKLIVRSVGEEGFSSR